MKTVWLVTHGATYDEPNPGMTYSGLAAITQLRKKLKQYLPQGSSAVHCGTGRRQIQLLEKLGFPKSEAFFSALWGEAPTLHKLPGGPKRILLGDGTIIDDHQYLSPSHLAGAIREALRLLPDNALICSGQPVLVRLGMKAEEGQSGALYALRIGDDNSIRVELVIPGVNLSK